MSGIEPKPTDKGKLVSVVFPQNAYVVLTKIADEELSTVPDVIRRLVAPTIIKHLKETA